MAKIFYFCLLTAPTAITRYPSDVEFTPFHDVIFPCSATIDPTTPINRRWFHENETIMKERTAFVANNGSLVLRLSEEDDGGRSRVGTYRCVVTNGYSSAERHVRLYLPVSSRAHISRNLHSLLTSALWPAYLQAYVTIHISRLAQL